MRKIFFTLLLITLTTSIFAQVQITNTTYYRTAEQMLLANEINESGEPFAEALGYNLDDLDPAVPYAPDSISYNLGINNYEYSRYQLGTIVSRSGMGLHMIWAPIIGEMAAMQTDPSFDGSMTSSPNGFKEDDMLKKNIMHFGMLANQMPPANPWPQFAEFIEGDPHLPQTVAQNFYMDFSTLRWDRSKMTKTLNPAAMGQTLMKQYLWAQDMLGAFHDDKNEGIDPDGTVTPDSVGSPNFDPNNKVFYGGDNADGFIGQILTAEGLNKVKFILTKLAYDGTSLGMVDPMTYDPKNGIKYFPHAVSVSEEIVHATMPPKPTGFKVTDNKSYLWDQFSLIWGTLSFTNMMDPNNNETSAHTAYHSVFDGNPFPAPMSQTGKPGPYDLMKGASMVLFQNIMAMHHKMASGSFTDMAWLENGQVVMDNTISTKNAGYILVALQQVINEFAGMPLEGMASNALKMQADFIIDSLKNADGSYANGYVFGTGADSSPTDVVSQATAIRGLYVAYEVTNNMKYLNAANTAYKYLIDNFYISSKHAFKTVMGSTTATYTPFNVAVLSGALRSASLTGSQSDAAIIYTRFFLNVGNAMQLSEGSATGETGNDSDGDGIPFITEQADGLPPVFASEATLAIITGIEDGQTGSPNSFALSQNYPNPFNPTTRITYQIPENSFVRLVIYNALGQMVKTLVNSNETAGEYNVNFNATDLPTGIYIYRLQAGNFVQAKKMILIK